MNGDAQIARQWAEGFIKYADSAQIVDAAELTAARYILATTTPPTMADMTPEELEACRWMQAIPDPDSGYTNGLAVIVQVQDERSILMWEDGSFDTRFHRHITPLPHLPRLKWPAGDPAEDTPDHPTELTTEEDYENAPEGTIVTYDEGKPFVLIDERWRVADSWVLDHGDMSGICRRVLRWGWAA